MFVVLFQIVTFRGSYDNMAAIEVTMPMFGEVMEEGTVAAWKNRLATALRRARRSRKSRWIRPSCPWKPPMPAFSWKSASRKDSRAGERRACHNGTGAIRVRLPPDRAVRFIPRKPTEGLICKTPA